ncbi:ABC transporter permease [Oceanobacillus halophilus]|uniref:ABC transporter permease n=1 Tax=Oceanobacillus halophilus TaxID=930130 RepID=A0A494ZS51_9BACI|nr:ABC transporter permease [Oceanobacillus halophilus]RKQ28668.1 ABC transporter permease [Oceanobacillus halophilus]
MLKYTIQRLFSLIPILLVVAVIVFLLAHMTPGDPVTVLLGDEASEEAKAELRHELGFDLPVYTQFVNWFTGVVTGDLGMSFFLKKPVTEVFADYLGPTISLAIYAQIIAIVISLFLGVIAAKKRGTFTDQTVMGFSLLGISVPSFLVGLFLILLFAVQLQWFPVAGYRPLSEGLWEHLRYLTLPAIALGMMQAGLITRMTRSSMLDVMKSNYIKTAKSKGLHQNRITYKHALRNSFIPILTVIGESFGTLITGAAVVETVFNIPGIGQLIVNSIERRDFTVIQGTVLLITVTYVLLNLTVDLLYGVVDPRVRLNRKK